MTDIIIKPAFSNSRPALEDAYMKALRGDRVVYSDGIYNIEGLTTYGAMVRVPAGVTSIAMNRRQATIRRGDNQMAHAILANANFDKAGYADSHLLFDGLIFDGNIDGQGGFFEHRHCLDLIGTQYTKTQWCDFVNLCGDGAYIGQTYDHNSRTARPHQVWFSDGYFNGDRKNRNGISWISATNSGTEGSCTFERLSRDDMPAAVDIEPDGPEDLCEQIAISGTFKDNKADVYAMAIQPGTRIVGCGCNIKPSPELKPWESIIARSAKGGEVDFYLASTPWDE